MNVLNKLLEKVDLGSMKYVERHAVRDYVNGKPSDDITGYKYVCVLPQMGYSQVSVKIMGAAQLDEPEQPYDVTCTNLRAVAYVNNANRVDVSFRADTIRPAKG